MMITKHYAIEIARKAIDGKVDPQPGSPVTAELTDNRYTVIFVHLNAPGTHGADYDAKVSIDANSGEVLEVLGGP